MREFCAKLWRAIVRVFVMDCDENYREGWEAYHNFERLEDNPYVEGSFAHCDWETGWVDASNSDE